MVLFFTLTFFILKDIFMLLVDYDTAMTALSVRRYDYVDIDID